MRIIRAPYVLSALLLISSCSTKPDVQEIPLEIPGGGGAICGSSEIIGKSIPPIHKGACGIDNPVEVYQVAGVKLSPSATLSCDTAQALNQYTKNTLKPEAKKLGSSLREMRVLSSYACRTRNSKKGAKLSEHAGGRAIDLGGFTLADGRNISVESHYYKTAYSGFLANSRAGACGIFGTVLGPGSDVYHRDHFHMDTVHYKMGTYCR